MARAVKTPHDRLMPSPKELDKALTLSADRARRMAEAFGLKVPAVALKPANAVAALQCRIAHKKPDALKLICYTFNSCSRPFLLGETAKEAINSMVRASLCFIDTLANW